MSCTTFSGGKWETSHQLSAGRYDHVSWDTHSIGIVLMGGAITEFKKHVPNKNSTELLSPHASTTTPAFVLPYQVRYSKPLSSVTVAATTHGVRNHVLSFF